MKGEWRFLIRKLAGKMVYQVYRLKDRNTVDDHDNREYTGGILHDKREAMKLAAKMNEEEASNV